MASYPNCTCGIVKNQQKEFTARYEFKTSSDRIKIVPHCGTLQSNEFIQINFIFKPKLAENLIVEEAFKLKMKIEEQEEAENDKSTKRGKEKSRKATKKEKFDEKKDLSDMDKLAGEISLLENFEPYISTIFVTCMIDLEMRNGAKYDELLYAKLICPITRPDILILNENREITFGLTATGTSARKLLLIKNISTQNVKADVSLLDPFGPFFVAPGKMIETGSILKLPVTYQPNENAETEVSHLEI
ncbi:Cilia- and flagella-associated protein 74 [Anthophora quadrimaculata]